VPLPDDDDDDDGPLEKGEGKLKNDLCSTRRDAQAPTGADRARETVAMDILKSARGHLDHSRTAKSSIGASWATFDNGL
jgi:hypothetical protein